MTLTEQLLTIGIVIAGTMLTRFLPFIIFPADKETPPLIAFLGKILPPAVMSMLVVYSLKNISFSAPSHALPESLAIAATILLQIVFKNLLLTISVSTICYMLLVQHILFNLSP